MGRVLSRYESTYFSGSTTKRNYAFFQSGRTSDFVVPTVYDVKRVRSTAGSNPPPISTPLYIDAPNSSSALMDIGGSKPKWAQHAANAAYEEFREAATGSQSSLGAAIAEWRESLGMIQNRAGQLMTSFNALRRKRFSEALRAFNTVKRRRPNRSSRRMEEAARKASGLWLEYSYGWKPAVQDMYQAMKQFDDVFPSDRCKGSKSTSRQISQRVGYMQYTQQQTIRHSTGGLVKLTNPNAYLLAQMGLANPLSIAWEAIPGSFIADWMFDVSSWVNSLSDFIGVEITNPWHMCVCNFHDTARDVRGGAPAYAIGYKASRSTSLIRPMPNLNVQANLGASIERAANLLALSTQACLNMLKR